ncbi:probable serine/threonine-protein kinase SIS8 isoform X2 [Physcomitrium patens]|uniref:non-specific serine/threonine protein kinase n=1 Tax=Physcomitrium patens TaxID=3218 RepID=A0A7I4BS43_PHYPA|nr:probable serine/threonine-protein kinase SIS8 isoform X3 [Physcomitrium patens]|eukprot:XP_024387109.1 probable serine/threonine-protein kinase SIS8 isoform X3 [Physcomitrella patens]
MSEFLSRIKARLETGQHYNLSYSEESGWVRAALANVGEEESAESREEGQGGGEISQPCSEWQAQLVKRMQGVRLGAAERSPVLTKSRSSPALGSVSSRDASQTLWDSKVLDSRLPNGFYSVIPNQSMKVRYRTIPTLNDLQQMGTMFRGLDVLLVDTNKDTNLLKLLDLTRVIVKGIGINIPLMIKKIAELVADFYGGPLFEAGSMKTTGDGYNDTDESSVVRLLGDVKQGLCRPRAILFKLLGDSVGLQSRLLMGLQLDAVPSSSLICANPNKHLSNVVIVNGIELLVDVMRNPGYLRPFSKKALVRYHIAGAGDSDSADYDSCDSPLEPNSPLYDAPDKLDHENLEQGIEFGRSLYTRRGRTAAAAAGLGFNPVLGICGKLSPSRSESDLVNPRRRNRRRAFEEQNTSLSPDHGAEYQLEQRNLGVDGFRSFPSSPEHVQTRLRPSQQVGSDDGSLPSSPEYPVFRPRAHSMLSGSRLHVGETTSSPDGSPQHPSVTNNIAPMIRRRSGFLSSTRAGDLENNLSYKQFMREKALSVDVRHDATGTDLPQSVGDPSSSQLRHNPHAEMRRPRRRTVAPEVPDEVVRVVRAMNEALKQERSRKKGQDPDSSSSDGHMLNCSREGKVASEKLLDASNADADDKQEHREEVSGPSHYDFNVMGNSESDSHSSRLTSKNNGEAAWKGSSGVVSDTNSAAASWTLPMQSASPPSQPLFPFPEWNIEFSELRIGVRVGIGSFGEVFRGIWRGTEVAIKVMLEQDLTDENMQDFCNEISLLSRLRHPNVILFLGACTTPPHLSMVTEYMKYGSLYRLIHSGERGKKLSWRRRLKMLRDICRGMLSVQRMKIVHRDLKSANCLVDKHWCVKICDFGLSRVLSGSTYCDETAGGTPEWTAPELLRNEPVTYKCDVFSLGVIMWELCTLRRPWEGVKPMQVVNAVAHQKARLEIPDGFIGKLIADCWEEVPESRPSYEEILTRLQECDFLNES